MRDVARGTFEDGRSPRRPREGGCDRSGLEKAYVLMAETFRAHLAVAGVDRAELFEKSESRRPIRIHDLRATFITVNLANGKTEAWIADRTGHTTSTMINRYRRAARTHAELGQGSLTPLDVVLGLPHRGPSVVSSDPSNRACLPLGKLSSKS